MNRYYSLVIVLFSISFSCINLGADEQNLSEKFSEVIFNNLNCDKDSYELINSDDELKNHFEVSLDPSVEMGRSILLHYCNKKDDKNFFIENSKEIFENLNEESPQIYYINIVHAFINNTKVKSKKDLLYQLKEQLLLFQNNINSDFVNSESWDEIIYFLAAHIQQFSNTSWNDQDYIDSISDHESISNTYLSILERLILNTISSEQSSETLNKVATILMEMRVLKLENMDEYASLREIVAEREYFLKTYLSKFKDGYIEYSEFNEIIRNAEVTDSQHLLELELSLDQASYLVDIATYTDRVGFDESDSQKTYKQILGEILVKNYDSDPTQALSSLAAIDLDEINYCPLVDKDYSYSFDEYDSLIAAMQLPISKYICSKQISYLIEAHDIAEQILVESDDNLDQIYDFYSFIPLFKLSYRLDDLVIEHEEFELQHYLKKIIDFQYFFINTNLFQTILKKDDFDFISMDVVKLNIQSLNEAIDGNQLSLDLDSRNKLELINQLFNKSKFDPLNILTQLKNDLFVGTEASFKEKINTHIGLAPVIFMSVLGFDVTGFNEFPEDLVSDLKSYKPDHESIKTLKDSLVLIDYLIDELFELNKSADRFNQIILSNPSTEIWSVFKEYITIEGMINLILVSARHLEYSSVAEVDKKRFSQVLTLRPDQIAISKFKDSYIGTLKDQEFRDNWIEYDRLQQLKKQLVELNMLTNGEQLAIGMEEKSRISFLYEQEIMNVQGRLFNHKDETLLHPVWDFSIGYPPILFTSLKNEELMISVISGFAGTMTYYTFNNGTFSYPSLAGTSFLSAYKEVFLKGLKDPEEPLSGEIMFELYDFIFDPISGLDNTKNIKNIYFIADETFSGIPVHALYDVQTKQHAIEKYTFNYLSSEKLFLTLEPTEFNRKSKFVAFGNPSLSKNKLLDSIENLFNKRGDLYINNISELNSLPETQQELTNISKFFNDSELFFEDDALESSLYLNTVSDSDILAFATHAVKGGNEFFNDRGLVLTPGDSKNFEKDGFLSSFEIQLLNLKNNPAVLLTACNTIESPYDQAEPYAGIAGSFMEAGAGSVLLSLWDIDSMSAKEFNESLFKGINRNNFELRDAAQASMISMIQSENYWHPHYWAPYVYLGR